MPGCPSCPIELLITVGGLPTGAGCEVRSVNAVPGRGSYACASVSIPRRVAAATGSVTVRGSRADGERELAAMVAAARATRAVGVRSTVSELLEAWFAVASTSWAPTTIRQTRSVLDCYLHPHLGSRAVGDIAPAIIDACTPAGVAAAERTASHWHRGTLGHVPLCLSVSGW